MVPITSRLLVLLIVLAGFAWPANEEEPERGVARISLINGDVSVRRGDSGDWVAASVNAPLVVEDHLLTGATSKAEAQFDWANFVRLAPYTEVRFAELEYRRYQLQLAAGTVSFRVLRDSEANVEINTPNVSVRPVKQGTYRVTVREDGDSEITVRSGEVEVFTQQGAETLGSGKTMRVRGSAATPEFQIAKAIPRDDWDGWNEDRDKQLNRSESYRYVSKDVYGAEDLDGNGSWIYVSPYGYVWRPYVAAGWAPYSLGRWSWVDWYGWTWVSYDPWGWAPYHYGRWFHSGPHGWLWYPGGMHVRHHWSPALVGFFGWGGYSGVHVGIGFGNVGWVPLAPYERYRPWYGRNYYQGYRNSTYIDNSVNIVNNVNITNVYRNARVKGGITAVGADDFVGGRVANRVRVSDAQVQRASLVQGQLPVTPGRESLRLSEREVRTVSRSSGNERFFSRGEPSRVDRVPFEQQQQSIRRVASGSRGAEDAAVNRTAQPDARRATSGAAAAGSNAGQVRVQSSEGWRSVGEPTRSANGETVRSTNADANSSRSREAVRSTERNANSVTTREATRSTTSGVNPGASREASPTTGTTWRRFGEPTVRSGRTTGSANSQGEGTVPRSSTSRTANGAATPTNEANRSRTSGTNSSGWTRFGEPSRTNTRSTERTATVERNTTSSGSGQSNANRTTVEAQRGTTTRNGAGREPTLRQERSEQRVRIAPPIVRERTTSRTQSSSSSANRSSTRSQPTVRSGGSATRAPARSQGTVRSSPSVRSGGAAQSSGTSGSRSGSASRSGGGGAARRTR